MHRVTVLLRTASQTYPKLLFLPREFFIAFNCALFENSGFFVTIELVAIELSVN